MKGINLLPEELKPKTYAINLSKDLRKYATMGLVIFFIALMVMGGTYFALNIRQTALNKTESNLKKQVKSYEASEQKLVLVEDRLTKIGSVLSKHTSSDSLNSLELVKNNLPENVQIYGVEIKPEEADITIVTGTSSDLGKFITALSNMGFSKISLMSLSYLKGTGYKVEVGLSK